MNRSKKIIASAMVLSMLISITSCAGNEHGSRTENPDYSKPEFNSTEPTGTIDPGVTKTPLPSDGIVDFTMFATYYGNEKDPNNDIKELIAEKTGVRVNEYYLTGQTPDEAVGAIIASGEYPDFIDAGDYSSNLYDYDVLVAWDPYLDIYPELKALYTDEEWDGFRQSDGHIYWANIIDRYKGKDTSTLHSDQAFWIQARVLEWDNYPKIETLDQYFDLLERYTEANPTMPNGEAVIPYTCLCEDWRYFCIEASPMYLDGYPNDGCVIVKAENGYDNIEIVDYNTTETAKNYLKKLNEEYRKGVVDPDFETQNYDEYITKLCSGRVLGMCDQYWDFGYTISSTFNMAISDNNGGSYTLSEIGCDYVPLGLVAEEGMEQHYHTYGSSINYASGIAVTTGCYDPDLAFKFLNDLLSQEIQDLRFWGIEGVDYLIDTDGSFYRTTEMNAMWKDDSYKQRHTCEYSYLPYWKGLREDGFNRMMPAEQPSIFKSNLSKALVNCFDAYGADNYVDMIGSVYCAHEPWYPLWSWSNSLNSTTHYGTVWKQINDTKQEWLPKLVMSENFDSDWDSYMTAYSNCDPEAFLTEAYNEVVYRINN